MENNNILELFHHIHHGNDGHEVHYCGGKHHAIDPALDYTINHCPCGKHSINKKTALGHAVNEKLETVRVKIKFTEKCPAGGWHVENGKFCPI